MRVGWGGGGVRVGEGGVRVIVADTGPVISC